MALAFRSSATSTAQTITAPSDIEAGDLLVLADRARQVASSPTSVVVSGFSSLNEITQTSGLAQTRRIVSYKLADGSEASASLTGMNGGSSNGKVLLVFSGGISVLTPNTWGGASVDTNPVAQTVTASGGTPPLVIFGVYSSDSAVDPRTFTVGGSPAKDDEVGVTATLVSLFIAWKIYSASPADASIDMDDEGVFNALQSGYIAVTIPEGQPIVKRLGGVPFAAINRGIW